MQLTEPQGGSDVGALRTGPSPPAMAATASPERRSSSLTASTTSPTTSSISGGDLRRGDRVEPPLLRVAQRQRARRSARAPAPGRLARLPEAASATTPIEEVKERLAGAPPRRRQRPVVADAAAERGALHRRRPRAARGARCAPAACSRVWSAQREVEFVRRMNARFVNVAEMAVPVEVGGKSSLDYVYRGRRAPSRAPQAAAARWRRPEPLSAPRDGAPLASSTAADGAMRSRGMSDAHLRRREEEQRWPRRRRGDMTVREAGRKGGEKVASERGHEFYEEIGKKGGEKVASRARPRVLRGDRQEGRREGGLRARPRVLRGDRPQGRPEGARADREGEAAPAPAHKRRSEPATSDSHEVRQIARAGRGPGYRGRSNGSTTVKREPRPGSDSTSMPPAVAAHDLLA